MIIDSKAISVSSLHALTELNIGNRQREEHNCDCDPKQVLHDPPPIFLASAKVTILSKQKSHLHHAPRLILIRACWAESRPWRDVDRADKRQITASKEALVLKGWCQRDRPC